MSHQQQIIYQQVVKQPTNGTATASMILGITAIIIGIWSFIPLLGIIAAFISFLPALLAVILGHVGNRKVAQIGTGSGQAKTGLILGYITLGIIAITTIFWTLAMIAGSISNAT